MMFSQEADQEGLLVMIYCIFSLADCGGGCILLNYLMQRFKTFPLEAFNSDSGKIKFWCLVFIITSDVLHFFIFQHKNEIFSNAHKYLYSASFGETQTRLNTQFISVALFLFLISWDMIPKLYL